MTPLWLLSSLLAGLAAILAGVLARRDRRHLPIAALLTANLAADDVRALLAWLVIDPARGPLLRLYGAANRPALTGWPRAAFHADEALVVAWSVGLAWCGWQVFADKMQKAAAPGFPEAAAGGASTDSDERAPSMRPVSGAVKALFVWAAIVAPMVALYPRLSGLAWATWDLGRVYVAVTAAGALGVLAAAARGEWQADRGARHLVMLVLVAGEAGAVVAHLSDGFRAWMPAQAGYCVAFAAIVAVQGRRLWTERR